MPYIDRDGQGVINGAYYVPQRASHPYLDEAHPEVVAYRTRPTPPSPAASKRAALLADPLVPQSVKDFIAALVL